MPRNHTIRKNGMSSFELMQGKPIVLVPFLIIAFMEGIALELIYFSTRKPLLYIAGPIIRKFSGELFLHYPYSVIKMSQYFYYCRVAIYVIAGVFLTAITVNILKNIKAGLPLKTIALLKNAAGRYLSFVLFGLIIAVLLFSLQKSETFLFKKIWDLASKPLQSLKVLYSLLMVFFSFLINAVFQTLFIVTVPILVVKQKSLLKALAESIALGLRHFFTLFTLIFLPLLLYFPVTLLNTYSTKLVDNTSPEIMLYIPIAGIILAAFVECFIIVCATQFLLEKDKAK